MYQPPINSFFNTRKRCASEYLSAPTSKKLLLASDGDALKLDEVKTDEKGEFFFDFVFKTIIVSLYFIFAVQKCSKTVQNVENGEKSTTNLTARRQVAVASRKRRLLPAQKISVAGQGTSVTKGVFSCNNSQENVEEKEHSVELSIKEIQKKVKNSKKLPDLKEQLKKLQEMEKKRQELLKQRKSPAKAEVEKEGGQALKKFDKLEMEVFTR